MMAYSKIVVKEVHIMLLYGQPLISLANPFFEFFFLEPWYDAYDYDSKSLTPTK